MGVAALVRLTVSAGDQMSPAVWEEVLATLSGCVAATQPDVEGLLSPPADRRGSIDSDATGTPRERSSESGWSVVQSPSHSPRASQVRTLDERKQVPVPEILDAHTMRGDELSAEGSHEGGGPSSNKLDNMFVSSRQPIGY